MFKTIKIIAFSITISITVLISSCVNTDIPERTAATEQEELNEALGKLVTAGYNIDTTKLGVYYIMNKVGTGNLPQKGDTCFLIYTGFFLNGIIFDTSANYYTDSIMKINHLETSLIPGFHDAIAVLKKGAEADVIIPSELAYGVFGYGDIPAYTPLVFSMKMRDLRPKK